MQVHDLRRYRQMKRDMDLIRDLLLRIESDPQMDGTREFYFDTAEEMGISDHSTEEAAYNLGLLITAGFIDGAVTIATPLQVVRGLTWDGHEFLDNIRSDEIWSKTKEQFKALPSVGLKVVAAAAQALVMKHIGLS